MNEITEGWARPVEKYDSSESETEAEATVGIAVLPETIAVVLP